MATSVSYAIQQALQTIMQAVPFASITVAGVTYPGIAAANVQIKMLPKVGETVDVVPCIRITPCDVEDAKPGTLEGATDRCYRIEVCVIDGLEGDFQTQQQQYEIWKEQVVNAVQRDSANNIQYTLPGCPTVWEIRVLKGVPFDRSKLAENYSYQSVVAEFYSWE